LQVDEGVMLKDQKKLDQMKEEHDNWKQEFAQNLYFDSSGDAESFFGMFIPIFLF
jgi:hypothetical protein